MILLEKVYNDNNETYFLLEAAYTTLTHNEAVDAWSSQTPEVSKKKNKLKWQMKQESNFSSISCEENFTKYFSKLKIQKLYQLDSNFFSCLDIYTCKKIK